MMAINLLKLLFCFKKPQVIQLSYLPVLIKDKPVLFAAWEIKNIRSIKFIPLDRSYYTTTNAVLLPVPNQLEHLTLKASNIWRKTTIDLSIRFVQLDEATIAQLIDGFRPLNKTQINIPSVAHIKNRLSISPFHLQQHHTAIQQVDRFNVTVQPFTIHIHPIHYQ